MIRNLFLLGGVLVTAVLHQAASCSESCAESTIFTIATYNVKNLFDDHDDPYFRDEQTIPVPKPMEEVRALAAVIINMNADVIALQEVESRGVLRKFKWGFLKDLNYDDPVLFEGDDMRGIDVALLSRLPVGPVTRTSPRGRDASFDNTGGNPS